MSKLEKLLSQYAAYHLDRKNVVTHFVGIPMIVFSIICLTARAEFSLAQYPITLALIIMILAVVYYISLDLIFGLMMGVIFAVAYSLAIKVADLSILMWLVVSIGLFVLGWIIQFVGHFYEQKKPAFVDDLIGLAIGPLFVLAELVFLLGMRKSLEEKMLLEAVKIRSAMDNKTSQAVSD